jgi:hypothetical protein
MMNLTEEPEIVNWPETHYVFVEKTGPFHEDCPGGVADRCTALPRCSRGTTRSRAT